MTLTNTKKTLTVAGFWLALTALVLPSQAAEEISQMPPSGSAQTTGSAALPFKNKWAVVVGLSSFKDPAIKCHFGAKDARAFADYLINDAHFEPDHVHILLDSEATRTKILTELGDQFLPRVAAADDLVVVFFSTNGTPAEMDVGAVNYLSAFDTQQDNLMSSAIAMQSLAGLIKERMHADHLILIVDAPYSGAVTEPSRSPRVLRSSAPISELIMASGSADQNVMDSNKFQNSAFAKYLIDGLRQRPTLTAAFDYLKQHLTDDAGSNKGLQQTPVIKCSPSSTDFSLSQK